MNNKLFKTGFIYTIGNVLIQGVSFITLPIYTKYMSLTDYGSFSLFSSWVAILSIIFGLQTYGTFSIAKIKFDEDYDEYVLDAIKISSISFLFLILLFIFFNKFISMILNFDKFIIVFIAIQSYFHFIQISVSQYLMQNQKSILNLFISAFSLFINVAISIFLIFKINSGFYSRVIGGLIPGVIICFSFWFYLTRKNKFTFRIKNFNFILFTSIPLVFHMISHQIISQTDKIMIDMYLTKESVALYSFSFTIAMILNIVLNSVNSVWIPWYFKEKKEENFNKINLYKKRYVLIATILTIGFLSVFPELVDILGNGAYKNNKIIIIVLTIGYYFSYLYTFPVNIQFYNENTKLIPVGTFISALFNIIFNYFLINKYGILGAAISTMMASVLLLLFHHFIVKTKYGYDEFKLRDYILFACIVIIYSVFTSYFISNLFIRWLVCVCILSFITVWFFKFNLKS